MATDQVDGIYKRLDALLYATGSAFSSLVKPGNRSRVDGASPPRNTMKPSLLPADAVDAELDYDGGDLSGFTADEHYIDAVTPLDEQSWAETDTHRFLLTLIAVDERLGSVGAAVTAARAAIRKGGPDLGLDYVDRLSISRRDTRETVKERVRRKCVLTITVVVTFQGADEQE